MRSEKRGEYRTRIYKEEKPRREGKTKKRNVRWFKKKRATCRRGEHKEVLREDVRGRNTKRRRGEEKKKDKERRNRGKVMVNELKVISQ